MNRYTVLRATVTGLEKTSHGAFRALRTGIDWLERREREASSPATPPASPGAPSAAGNDPIDEGLEETFPASDPPSSWAGPPAP